MLFHAATKLFNRHGDPYREAKMGAKAGSDGHLADADMRDMTYGSVAIMALDQQIAGDEKMAKDDPSKWVKRVMERDEAARKIADALKGDGWADLEKHEMELIKDRLAQFALRYNGAMIGPVLHALEHPPKVRHSAADEDQPALPHMNGAA